MKLKEPKLLFVSILVSNLAGILGSLATSSSISDWYVYLNKPSFNPPNWIFGPVWTVLYTIMGISLYLVWIKGYQKKKVKSAVQLFFVHLMFNTLWTFVFFGSRNLLLALGVIIILWLMIASLIKIFWNINKWASYLLVPYILWVSFATLLNYSIWRLN